MKQKMRPFKRRVLLPGAARGIEGYPRQVPRSSAGSRGVLSRIWKRENIWCRETCLLGNPSTYEVILGKPFLCLSKIPYHQQALVCIVFFMHSPQDRFISGHACFSITDYTATLLDSIYESYKDVDGLLYMSTVAERFLVK
nr:PREDICTED: uncharacterized protein LOC103972389 isoform X2 [Musa acuminata subsp. malaccensis]